MESAPVRADIRPRFVDRAVLLAAVGAQTVGLGLIVALLADIQDAHGLPTWGLGLIAGASFAAAFIGHLTLAQFADRGHARLMMIAGAATSAVALLWLGVATSLWEFVAARALVGLAEGSFVPAARRVVLDWTPSRPGLELGRVFAAAIIGFTLGPPLGAFLAGAFGLSVPFFVVGVVAAATIPFLATMRIPAVGASERRGRLWSLLALRYVRIGILLASTTFLAIGALDAILARLLTDLGASTTYIGVAFAVFLTPLALLAPLGGRLADRYNPAKVGLVGVVVSIPLVAAYGFAATPLVVVVVSAVYSASFALVEPSAAAAVARGSPAEQLAAGQGLLEASGLVFAAVSALIAAPVYQSLGPEWLFGGLAVAIGMTAIAIWALMTAD